MNLKQAVVFAILMENNDGVIGKHPSYIQEKLTTTESFNQCYRILDRPNSQKLLKWLRKWDVADIYTVKEMIELWRQAGEASLKEE